MGIARRIARYIASSGFHLAILLLPTLAAAAFLFGSPRHIETIISNSGAYDNFVSAILDQTKANDSGTDAKTALDDKQVVAAIHNSFSPVVVRSMSESALSGFYNWLSGKSDQPNFIIDVATPRKALLTDLSTYAEQRTAGLAICDTAQLAALQTKPQDILSLPCRPSSLDPTFAGQSFGQDIIDGGSFLKKDSITAADLPKDSHGKTVTDRYSWAPEAYQWLKLSPFIVGGLAILLGTFVILTAPSKRKGIRSVAISLLGTGFFLLVGATLYFLVFRRLGQLTAPTAGSTSLQNALTTALQSAINQFNLVVAMLGVGYVLIGAGAQFALRQTRSSAKQSRTSKAVRKTKKPHKKK